MLRLRGGGTGPELPGFPPPGPRTGLARPHANEPGLRNVTIEVDELQRRADRRAVNVEPAIDVDAPAVHAAVDGQVRRVERPPVTGAAHMSGLKPDPATDMHSEEVNAPRVNPAEIEVPFKPETVARQGGEPRACETDGDGICLAKVRRLIKVAVSQYQRTPDPGVPKIKSTHNTRPRKAQDGARLIIPPARKVGDKFSPDLPFRRPSCPAETSSASGEPARRSSGRPQPSNSRSRSSAAPGTARLFIS
jgi:hypothetical protein